MIFYTKKKIIKDLLKQNLVLTMQDHVKINQRQAKRFLLKNTAKFSSNPSLYLAVEGKNLRKVFLPNAVNSNLSSLNIEYLLSQEAEYLIMSNYIKVLGYGINNKLNLKIHSSHNVNQLIMLHNHIGKSTLMTEVNVFNQANVIGTVKQGESYTITSDSFILEPDVIISKPYIASLLVDYDGVLKVRSLLLRMVNGKNSFFPLDRLASVKSSPEYKVMIHTEEIFNDLLKIFIYMTDSYIIEKKLPMNLLINMSTAKIGWSLKKRLAPFKEPKINVKISKIKTQLNESKISDIINDFRSYRVDLVKMMERPILSDLSDSSVKEFNHAIKLIEANREGAFDVYRLESEWESLQSYADKKNTSHLSDKERQRLKDSKTILDKAISESSTENEKKLSIRALTNNLNGLLPINDNVRSWLSEKTGILEIEE